MNRTLIAAFFLGMIMSSYINAASNNIIDQNFRLYLELLNEKSDAQMVKSLSIIDDWNISEKRGFSRFVFSSLENPKCKECGENLISGNVAELKKLASRYIMIGNYMWGDNMPTIPNEMDEKRAYVRLTLAENGYSYKYLCSLSGNTNNISNPTPSKESITLEQQKQIMENLLLWHCEHDGLMKKVIAQLSELPEEQRRETLLWMASKLTDLRFSPCLGEPVPADQHDLSLVGGKCAFILERLLDTKIAPVNKSVPPDQILREQQRITELIKQRIPKE